MISHSVEETRALGAHLAKQALPGQVFALTGDLGTGKTEFVRGFVLALAPEATVRSPSFSIINTYRTPRYTVYHFDFYRLSKIEELDEIGFEEYQAGDGVCLIEWGTMFPDVLPSGTRIIRFFDEGDGVRRIEVDE